MGDTFRLKSNGTKPVPVRSGLIAALDVGSSKVACIIGRKEVGALKVLGSAVHESAGIRSGAVTSLGAAEQSIRECVDTAEQLADCRIQDVILAVQCGQPKSLGSRVECEIGGALIADNHLRELLAQGKRRCSEAGYETIQAAPTGYVVDQQRGVRDPRGMYCDRLGVIIHAVAVRSGPLQNLRLAVENCHLSISRQLYSPYASALATLTADEMSLGCTLIDLGAGTTSVAVFIEDAMVHVDSVPIGGHHVTSDIARMLSAPMAAAERIKSLYGSALGDLEAGGDLIEVPQMGEDGDMDGEGTRVRRSLLTRIVQSRMEEIFQQVNERLTRSGFDVAAGRRLVLTGGGCQLAGARELAGRMMNKQVRLGRPQAFPGLAAAASGPAYATAIGLLISGATNMAEAQAPAGEPEPEPERRGLARWLGF
jgi:cell division protein FtsA